MGEKGVFSRRMKGHQSLEWLWESENQSKRAPFFLSHHTYCVLLMVLLGQKQGLDKRLDFPRGLIKCWILAAKNVLWCLSPYGGADPKNFLYYINFSIKTHLKDVFPHMFLCPICPRYQSSSKHHLISSCETAALTAGGSSKGVTLSHWTAWKIPSLHVFPYMRNLPPGKLLDDTAREQTIRTFAGGGKKKIFNMSGSRRSQGSRTGPGPRWRQQPKPWQQPCSAIPQPAQSYALTLNSVDFSNINWSRVPRISPRVAVASNECWQFRLPSAILISILARGIFPASLEKCTIKGCALLLLYTT